MTRGIKHHIWGPKIYHSGELCLKWVMNDLMLGENIKALEKATVCSTKYTSQFVDCTKQQARVNGQNCQDNSLT